VSNPPLRAGETVAKADVVDLLAALEPNSRIAQLRHLNGGARSATQGSFDALLEPETFAGLPRVERELIALRVAVLQNDAPLAAFHRERARSQRAGGALLHSPERLPDRPVGSDRWSEVLRFVDRLTLDPAMARANDVKALHRHGLVARDVVTLAQLVAFTNFEVRLLAGLRALAALAPTAATPANTDTAAQRGRHPARSGRPARTGSRSILWSGRPGCRRSTRRGPTRSSSRCSTKATRRPATRPTT
jgi:AhpD family alkylhydroperoxidase